MYSYLRTLLCVSMLIVPNVALGQITFNFTRGADNGVDVVASGSGPVLSNTNSNNWTIDGLSSDFLSDALGLGNIDSDFASGTISFTDKKGNVTSRNVLTFGLNRNADSNDNLYWATGTGSANKLNLKATGSYALDFNAEFDSTTLSFDSLMAGTYSAYSSDFGTITVNVSAVPEPSSFMLISVLAFAAAGFTFYRRNLQKSWLHSFTV